MAKTVGAIEINRKAIRAALDTLRQNLPDLIRTAVLKADGEFRWISNGSVYQYTRFETLRGLLGGSVFQASPSPTSMSELWATSSMYLNDAKEFLRGREVITQELANLPDDEARRLMKLSVKDADPLEVYCACFSARGDDLSQWRGYGDNGAGVCIEFDLSKLIAEMNGIGYWVIYGKPNDEDLQMAVARDLLHYIHASLQTGPLASVSDAVMHEFRQQLREIWPPLFLALKHKDFSAEEEFRIVYSEAVGRQVPTWFRPAPLVPFVKLGMASSVRLPITSICLGPAVGSEANERSLRLALDKLGLTEVMVRRSDIPYVPH